MGGIVAGRGPGLGEFCFRELTLFGGGVLESSGRTGEGEAISWTRWARVFDKEGPLVEGEGGGV